LTGARNQLRADTGVCGGANANVPFLDVTGNPFFCAIAATCCFRHEEMQDTGQEAGQTVRARFVSSWFQAGSV